MVKKIVFFTFIFSYSSSYSAEQNLLLKSLSLKTRSQVIVDDSSAQRKCCPACLGLGQWCSEDIQCGKKSYPRVFLTCTCIFTGVLIGSIALVLYLEGSNGDCKEGGSCP